MNTFFKLFAGLAISGIILYKLPVLEIATVFFYFTFIPLVFLTGLGLIGSGSVDLLSGTFNEFNNQVRERLKVHRDKMAAHVPVDPAYAAQE